MLRRVTALSVVVAVAAGLAVAASAMGAGRPNPVTGFRGSNTKLGRSFEAVNRELGRPARLRAEALAGLHSKSGAARFAAVYALSLTAAPGSSLRALRPFARSSSVDERMMAASSLVTHGDRAGLAPLVAALGSGRQLGYLNEPVWQYARFVLLSYTTGDFGLRRAKTLAQARRTQAAWARAVHKGIKWRHPRTAAPGRKTAVTRAVHTAGGGTSVDVSGNTITYTIPVDVYGVRKGGKVTDPDTGESFSLIQWWQDGANEIWQKALADFRYRSSCGSYKLKVNLELFNVESSGQTPGHHKIDFWSDIPQLRTGIVFPDPHDGSTHNSDSTAPFEQPLDGVFGKIDPNTVAHETGHLMGLGDDYDDVLDANGEAINSTPHPGRGETIMRSSRLENVDQALVDRLGKLLEKAGKLPACWTGTIESDSQRIYVFSDGGGAQCNDHWHSDLSFMVKPGTSVTGKGTMTLTSGPTCSGKIDTANIVPTREIDFSVSGTKQKDRLTLTFGSTGYRPPPPAASYAGITTLVSTGITATGPPLAIPITGACTAGGPVATSYMLNSDTFTAKNVFALKCKDT